MTHKTVIRKIFYVLFLLILLYLMLGAGFHIKWKCVLEACRGERFAQGEIVEPEVYGNALGAFFDILYWPVNARANISHFGTPFSSPCDH